jgi:hypothetical protein
MVQFLIVVQGRKNHPFSTFLDEASSVTRLCCPRHRSRYRERNAVSRLQIGSTWTICGSDTLALDMPLGCEAQQCRHPKPT